MMYNAEKDVLDIEERFNKSLKEYMQDHPHESVLKGSANNLFKKNIG